MRFPRKIQIQTTSYCNAACPYCPYPSISKSLPMGTMPSELFYKIVDELLERDIELICPYFQAEPLMDDRIFDFINYIRERSKVHIGFATNAIALTSKKAMKLAQVENTTITFNVPNLKSHAANNLKYFLKLNRPSSSRVHLIFFPNYTNTNTIKAKLYWTWKGVDVVSAVTPNDRAGNVAIDDPYARVEGTACKDSRDTEWLHVLWNGDVVLCCQDWRREQVFGNVSKHSIAEVYNNMRYKRVRTYIRGVEMPRDFICRRCNLWINDG